MMWRAGFALLAWVCSLQATALTPEAARELYDRASKSIVVVQYTVDAEFGRQELTGQGLVIGEEGIVVTALNFFPRAIPDAQMKDFRILLPGDDEREFDAIFLGRDDRVDMAFLKTKEPQKWPAVQFKESELKVRQNVYSVGLLPKEAGYKPYFAEAFISAVLRGPTPYALVSPGGLTSVSSPVFNEEGTAIGWVPAQQGQSLLLETIAETSGRRGGRDAGGGGGIASAIAQPARFFVPARDFLPSLSDMPNGEPLKLPWLGAVLTGLNKDVAEIYDLKNTPAVQIGEVIPNTPASEAGLKPNDKIIKVNGEPLERGDEPNEAAMILNRKLRRMDVGETITLSVLRERNKPPMEIKVILAEQPRQSNLAERFYAEDLGLAVRELVFEDLYLRRLPADRKGVLVAFVRPASSTASAGLRNGDVITELNSTPITGIEQFQTQYKQFREQKPKDVVVLVVVREGNTQVIRIEPPQ